MPLVGPNLEVLLQLSYQASYGSANLLAGTLLLLHLCDPAQYGTETAAAACAAVAALLQDGSSVDPSQSPQAARLLPRGLARAHAEQIINVMQHEGLAAKAAQLRSDTIVVLATLAFRDEDAASGQQADILQHNVKLFRVFAPCAIQVRQGHASAILACVGSMHLMTDTLSCGALMHAIILAKSIIPSALQPLICTDACRQRHMPPACQLRSTSSLSARRRWQPCCS